MSRKAADQKAARTLRDQAGWSYCGALNAVRAWMAKGKSADEALAEVLDGRQANETDTITTSEEK